MTSSFAKRAIARAMSISSPYPSLSRTLAMSTRALGARCKTTPATKVPWPASSSSQPVGRQGVELLGVGGTPAAPGVEPSVDSPRDAGVEHGDARACSCAGPEGDAPPRRGRGPGRPALVRGLAGKQVVRPDARGPTRLRGAQSGHEGGDVGRRRQDEPDEPELREPFAPLGAHACELVVDERKIVARDQQLAWSVEVLLAGGRVHGDVPAFTDPCHPATLQRAVAAGIACSGLFVHDSPSCGLRTLVGDPSSHPPCASSPRGSRAA